MKKFIISTFIIFIFKSGLLFNDPLHTREMMMQVVNSGGSPVAGTVKLYKNFGYYFDLYRTGTSESYWRWVTPDANVACDIGDNNTNNPTWEPIEPGEYILWCDNKFAILLINTTPVIDGDFNIKFQNGTFTIIFNNRGVTLGPTYDWNKVVATFGQKKADGSTNVGTVSIGLGPSFSQRYSAPYEFYTNRNETYLFDADPDIYDSEKYHHYQNITDIRNFREQFIGTQNYSTTAMFNPTQPGVVISNFFLEYPLLNPDDDEIQFKDPWLIDFNDPLHGNKKRSRGTYGAIFQPLLSPFYPNFNTPYNGNTYKGVFLNQEIAANKPYYSVKASTQDITLYNTGKTSGRNHKFYFRNWSADPPGSAAFQNANATVTAVVFTNTNAIAQANLKGTNLSADPKAYNTTSQRKFIKTPDGYLHSVYSSLNRVWYEISSDNGATWQILNFGKPLNNGEGKLPSIDYAFYEDPYGNDDIYWTVIVYQEKFGSGFKIKAKSFINEYSEVYLYQDSVEVATYSNESYSNNANPVLAIDVVGYITFLWEQKSGTAGLYRRNGQISSNGLFLSGSNVQLSGTGMHSINPSIAVTKLLFSGSTRHIVWQAPGLVNSTDIIYKTFEYSGSQSDNTNISNGNGYPVNYSPSISLANGKPVVSWTGYYDNNIRKITGEQGNLIRKRALVKVRGSNGWPSVCTELGDNVNYVNNNSVISASEKTVFVWSQGAIPQSKWIKRTGSEGRFSNIGNLSHSGIENQLTVGSDFNNMYAMVFNKQSLPYYFIKSTTNFSVDQLPGGGGINKITLSDSIITYGRSGIVSKSGVEFVFNTGDIFVADSTVQFTFIPDTLLFNSAEELNTAARTENFWLEEGVDFFFSNLYYVLNHELADSVLTEQDQVNFKVELVKEQNGEVIGTFDNITYSKYNLEKYASINYQVNCSGIQAGEYYLRLATTVAGEAAYNLSNIQRDEFDLNKLNYVNVSFKGETIPITYELSQNYPNPFNPTTTIRYQIPKDGMVTLKVYDILGAEVVTLVNEEKVAGKYEVNFNASRLASGVYIYRLNVNDPSTSSGQGYVSVKKMVILK